MGFAPEGIFPDVTANCTDLHAHPMMQAFFIEYGAPDGARQYVHHL
jgi:hypothetical protein